ncbi:ribonuclease BN (tRNA processing enzyme) [Metabacillus crassostreae]|uniref:MBL fold metallo-hydrolase n=1 Tax=Metabacillus crassostreae TaxID=929098 RepID=UPI001956897A|nr:MBL fold metallo-hydrolase [Metabacillus crassostreae]MBM7604175.1 ribonuclease BN (tRNA processing enzyme) [Metabacillus crassostreae]
MKLKVIGYWGGYPEANEATSGYLIESNGFNLLIDCGSAVLSKLQESISIDQLDAVVLSHYHHDHIADIGPLQYACYVTSLIHNKDKTLPIYAHALDQEAYKKLTYKQATKGIEYDHTQQIVVGPFTISFLPTIHPAPCFAMKISDGNSSLVYTADSSYQDEFISFSSSADLLIAECSLYGNQDGTAAGHMNSTEVGRIAHLANVKKLLLTHLPHFGDHQDLIKEARNEYKGEISLAKTGFTWSSN